MGPIRVDNPAGASDMSGMTLVQESATGPVRAAAAPPALERRRNGERLELSAAGAWTVEHASALEPLVDAAGARRDPVRRVLIDIAHVDRLDTYGAWLIERLVRTWQGAGLEANVVGVSDRHRGLLQEVRGVNREPPPAPLRRNGLTVVLENVGRAVADTLVDVSGIVQMLGESAVAVLRAVIHPTSFRLTSVVHHLDRVGLQAVPIILLITFLLGCIIAQQGLFHFRRFGAELYVVDMIGILVLREIGVVMVS